MKYKLMKIAVVVFCSLFMAMGAVALINALLNELDPFLLIWGGLFFAIPGYVMVTRLKQIARFEKMTYQWYCAAHPAHVRNNKVSCFGCGNARIHVRALYNRTYHREHFCTQCGKTLYYSPEQA